MTRRASHSDTSRRKSLAPSGQAKPAKQAKRAKKAKRARTFAVGTPAADALDTLLRTRFHGAVNIRGIRFQVRYAALRAIQVAEAIRQQRGAATTAGHSAGLSTVSHVHAPVVRFEGLEDVDIADPEVGPIWLGSVVGPTSPTTLGGEYVQVKTADSPWSWSRLRDPLVGWIELVRTGAAGLRLRLVVNFELRGDLDALARFATLSASAQRDIRQKFRKLAGSVGATPMEADGVLDALEIARVDDAALRDNLRHELTAAFGLADDGALDAYELALTGRVLDWSARRDAVSAHDVLEFGRLLGEGLARQAQFRAVGERLASSLVLDVDASPEDFYAGQRTRLGHVVGGLDVRRPEWTAKIDQALKRAGVCVLRAPSGHGKSTLAFRYVVDHWPMTQTVVVRRVETAEDVDTLCDYLRFRAGLGVPLRVLIDADFRTRRWPEVAAAAAAVGAQVLVTVRTEDYQRFPIQALTRREILEPTLSAAEADAVFRVFAARGQVAASIPSAAAAFERLRTPPLLLEFVHLITQGVMLEERLRDQLAAFDAQGEDPAKREILRLVSLGSALGSTVSLDALLDEVALTGDPQVVFGSLLGEYVSSEDGQLSGLHWVRAEHLARLLHEGGIPPVHRTVLRLLPLVPAGALPFVVANAFDWPGLDRSALVAGLVARYRDADVSELVAVVQGMFEAGERAFFAANRTPFDEARAALGADGLLLLWAEVAPILRPRTIAHLREALGARPGLDALADWSARIGEGPRGLTWAREFLEAVAPFREAATFQADGPTGRLLDWAALAGISFPAWAEARDRLTDTPPVDGGDAEVDFVQGLSRYDAAAFSIWFDRHRDDWIACVAARLAALSLDLRAPSEVSRIELARARDQAWATSAEALSLPDEERRDRLRDATSALNDAARNGDPALDVHLEFAVAYSSSAESRVGKGSGSVHEQARAALDLLRRAFPSAGRYLLRGSYLLPDGLVPPVDDSRKAVPRWNLPLPSDVAKNRVWGDVVARAYLPDSFYRFQSYWSQARRSALELVRAYVHLFTRLLKGQAVSGAKVFGENGRVLTEAQGALRESVWLNAEEFALLGQPLSPALAARVAEGAPSRWRGGLQTFVRQANDLIFEGDEQSGKLAHLNFVDATRDLVGMHSFFAAMFGEAPDYFDMRGLDGEERRAYDELLVLLHGRVVMGVAGPLTRPLVELRARRTDRDVRAARLLEAALRDRGLDASVAAPRVVEARGLRSAVIGVSVTRLQAPVDDLLPVLEALGPELSGVDWLYLVPLRDGHRLGEGAYSLSADQVRQVFALAGRSDSVAALDPEAQRLMWALLSPLPLPEELQPMVIGWPLAPEPPTDLAVRAKGVFVMLGPVLARQARIRAVGADSTHAAYTALRRELTAALAPVIDELLATVAELERAASCAAADPGAELRAASDVLLAFVRDARGVLLGSGDADTHLPGGVLPDAEVLASAVDQVADYISGASELGFTVKFTRA